MCSSILVAKKELRKRMVALLGRLAKSHVTEASAQACRHVVESRQFQEASSISLFLSMPGEFDTSPLLRAAFDARKSVFVPRVCGPRREDMQMVRLFDINDIDGAGFEQSKYALMPQGAEGRCAGFPARAAQHFLSHAPQRWALAPVPALWGLLLGRPACWVGGKRCNRGASPLLPGFSPASVRPFLTPPPLRSLPGGEYPSRRRRTRRGPRRRTLAQWTSSSSPASRSTHDCAAWGAARAITVRGGTPPTHCRSGAALTRPHPLPATSLPTDTYIAALADARAAHSLPSPTLMVRGPQGGDGAERRR